MQKLPIGQVKVADLERDRIIDMISYPESRYEVLLPVEDERGITTYKRVGIIKPIKGRIWDNQYMANLENTAESALDATYFEKVSGGDFFPGMLIREM